MDLPLIAVAASLSVATDARPARVAVNEAYLQAIEGAGGVPVVLAPGSSEAVSQHLLAQCSGLMLTGGGDVSPERYGEAKHTTITGVSDQRDAMEFGAVGMALARDMPILAICRGMQILNVALGGSLWQDLPSQRPSEIRHRQDRKRNAATHEVLIEAGSKLSGLLGSESVSTNSMHHQGLKDLGDGLHPVGWTDDGLVEGVEMPGRRFVLGVQWHPEELTAEHEHARRLFEGFVRAARERK